MKKQEVTLNFKDKPIMSLRTVLLGYVLFNGGINFQQRQDNGNSRLESVISGASIDNIDDFLDGASKIPMGSWIDTLAEFIDDKDLPDVDPGGEGALPSVAAVGDYEATAFEMPLPDRQAAAVIYLADVR
ncbi:MAG: hypothetical protein KIH63_002130 [Candidatus Saccharibacteria bacterium]|nr:hypothetical protein [Candidatus Saccharibacteria bacterium]